MRIEVSGERHERWRRAAAATSDTHKERRLALAATNW
jgi:hypothetical protein